MPCGRNSSYDNMIAPHQLSRFSPLDNLTGNGLQQVAAAVVERRLGPGDILFNKGDNDDTMYFLLDGTATLLGDEASAPVIIKAGSEAAIMPLSRLKPRRFTARASTPVTLAAIDEDWLDNLLTSDQTAAYVVTEIPGEDPEWMFRLMCNPTFAKIPSDNFATLFSHLERIEAPVGKIIIRQGEPGDYYYIMRQGKAHVWRTQADDKPVMVDTVKPGDGFGEEALLSGDPRNATVVTVEPSVLMRLSMDDFNQLLKPALARRVDSHTAANQIGAGARFIDVRGESEYRAYSLPASINLPLCQLRQKIGQLDPKRRYITVCQTGRRATAAAFLLSQRGFDVQILDGGLNAIKPAS